MGVSVCKVGFCGDYLWMCGCGDGLVGLAFELQEKSMLVSIDRLRQGRVKKLIGRIIGQVSASLFCKGLGTRSNLNSIKRTTTP